MRIVEALNHEVNVAAKKRSAGKAAPSKRRTRSDAPSKPKAASKPKAPSAMKAGAKRAQRSPRTNVDERGSRPAEEIRDLDLEAAFALERFAQYARVALTSLRAGNRLAYVAHLKRVHASYECIYGHPVALMVIVREAKSIVDAVTLHHHAQGDAVDLEGVPSWVTRSAFDRLLASTALGRGGRSTKQSVARGVVRLVHARCPHPGAKRLRAEHLTST